MKQKRYKKIKDFAGAIGLDPARALEAELKANLTGALIKEISRQGLTHEEVAECAGVWRDQLSLGSLMVVCKV